MSNESATKEESSAAAAAAPRKPEAVDFEPPLTCVRRILKNTLPNVNVGKDASAAFARASGIFIIYLTACANDFAREHKRQTITANDILAAVKELDFEEFMPEMTAYLEAFRSAEKEKKDAKAKAKEEKTAAATPQGEKRERTESEDDVEAAVAVEDSHPTKWLKTADDEAAVPATEGSATTVEVAVAATPAPVAEKAGIEAPVPTETTVTEE